MNNREVLVAKYKKLWNDKGRKCDLSEQELSDIEIDELEVSS